MNKIFLCNFATFLDCYFERFCYCQKNEKSYMNNKKGYLKNQGN
jgi:hypothetical protein